VRVVPRDGGVVMRVIVHMAVVVVMVICLAGHFSRLLGVCPIMR
jgi:hypothetical protein